MFNSLKWVPQTGWAFYLIFYTSRAWSCQSNWPLCLCWARGPGSSISGMGDPQGSTLHCFFSP